MKIACVFLLVIVTGCFARASFNELPLMPLGSVPSRPVKPVGGLTLFMGQQPDRPCVDVVRYTPTGLCPDHLSMIEKMKELAAAKGFDGIHSIRCGAPGTVGGMCCDGIGFIYK